LDQESRPPVPLASPPGRTANARVPADRGQPRHQRLRRSPRTLATRRSLGNAVRNPVCVISNHNPPRTFRLGRKPPGPVRPPALLLSPAAFAERPRQRQRTLEGPQVFG